MPEFTNYFALPLTEKEVKVWAAAHLSADLNTKRVCCKIGIMSLRGAFAKQMRRGNLNFLAKNRKIPRKKPPKGGFFLGITSSVLRKRILQQPHFLR